MTRRLYGLGLLLACALCLGAGQPSPAADEKKAEEPKVDQAGEDVIHIGLAYSLAEYGRKNKSPESLVTAARILRKIKTTPITEKPTDEGPKGEKADEVKAGAEVSLLAESDKLLDEARKMAPDDKLIGELADRAAKEKTRAALGGPRSYSGAIRAGHTQTLTVSFRVAELASVTVNGNGVTVFHVKAINDAGVVVSENSGRYVNLRWVPERTRVFRIVITSEGPGPSSYQFYTN
jgi:hypothetical protein